MPRHFNMFLMTPRREDFLDIACGVSYIATREGHDEPLRRKAFGPSPHRAIKQNPP